MRSVENYINEDKYFSGIELFMRMKFRLEYYNVTRSLGNKKKAIFNRKFRSGFSIFGEVFSIISLNSYCSQAEQTISLQRTWNVQVGSFDQQSMVHYEKQ